MKSVKVKTYITEMTGKHSQYQPLVSFEAEQNGFKINMLKIGQSETALDGAVFQA